ncbi:SufD family Fe-S cluster assembly protein [Thermosipho ferrireducens]|uniref:SufD family Fe-S cluster assembly protein n=1 Tax=Thermosipho ferrireducens TaxID=2571116 RepID=A0ABX7S7U4_9BACT|nr:SufD family Fe-S cluster assembly protein [Thermosipho ferrireducens]QTA37185.1 SufD family Fe-S cluster assembly protein [Thermosipho ferrireducens]
MEKTIELKHGDNKAVIAISKELKRDDYGRDTFTKVLKSISNAYLKEYVKEKYEEYEKIGFPVWKRTNIENFNLLSYEYKQYFDTLDKSGVELLKKLDFDGSHRKFVLLSDVFSFEGDYIVIEDDKLIKKEYGQTISNDLIHVKKGSLTLIRILRPEMFSNHTTRILVSEGASLTVYNIHEVHGNSYHFDNVFIEVEEKANVKVRDFYAGSGVSVGYFGVKMSGKEANVDLKPYFIGTGNGRFDLLYMLRFVGMENTGVIKAEGTLANNSKLVFRGILDLKKGAKNSVAEESEKAILLSKDAKMEAIPSLWVDENEVTASHAASSAPLDDNAIFYLMSRGFSKDEAKRYIIEGIYEELIQELKKYGLEGMVENALKGVVG